MLDVTPDHSSFLNAWVTTDAGGRPEKHEQCLSSPNGRFLFILHVNGERAVHEALQPDGDVTTCCDLGRGGHSFEEGWYVLQLQETGLMPVFKNSASPPSSVPKYLTCTIADEPKGFFHLDMRGDGQLILYKGQLGSQNENDAVWTAIKGSLKESCSKGNNSQPRYVSCPEKEACATTEYGIQVCRCLAWGNR